MMAVRSGRAIPPRFLEPPPEVQAGLGIYMRAFFDLASDRQQQGGRILWSAVQWWCEAQGLDADEARDMHFLVGRMDLAFLAWAKDKKPDPTTREAPDRHVIPSGVRR